MRNGVLAITRDGAIAEMNDEAFRIFQLKRTSNVVGRPFSEVLGRHPDMVRLYREAREMMSRFERADIAHVRREQNKEADRLANRALDERASKLD